MSEVIELKDISNDPQKLEAAVQQVVDSLRRGEIIVAAVEHAYVYACDAFDRDAVTNLHTLRGDDFGVAAQVMIGNAETLEGLAQDVSSDVKALTDKFWPGLLTLHIQPHMGLNWDLGDEGELGEFAVRIPDREFFLSVLNKSGPLAVASAAITGRPPAMNIGAISALASDVGIYIDEGELSPGPVSTVVQQKIIGDQSGLEVVREGAITLAQLTEVLPTISTTSE